MLEALTSRINFKVPMVVHKPVYYYDARLYWQKKIGKLTDHIEYKMVEGPYRYGSIRFISSEIYALNEEEFLLLQELLQNEITTSFLNQGQELPSQVAAHLIPGVPKNVLVHEKEHLDAVPEHVIGNSSIDIFLQKGNELPDIQLNGVAYYDMLAATDYENAWICSNPRYLGNGDVRGARKFASKTKDTVFIDQIEQRISERETYEE